MRFLCYGDFGRMTMVYAQGLVDAASVAPKSWQDATRCEALDCAGGAGTLVDCLRALGHDVATAPVPDPVGLPRSVFVAASDGDARWWIHQAVTSAERDYPGPTLDLDAVDRRDPNTPLIIVDYAQGFVGRSASTLAPAMAQHPHLVRTHDPTDPVWRAAREASGHALGIWYAPVQDLDGGALVYAGTWADYRARVSEHLQRDPTLWDAEGQRWRQKVVIQIGAEGALLFMPGLGADGSLQIVAGEQPFGLRGRYEGLLIGLGALYLVSLAEVFTLEDDQRTPGALEGAVRRAISRSLALTRNGLRKPAPGPAPLPIPEVVLRASRSDEVVAWPSRSQETPWAQACALVTGKEADYRRRTVYRLGKLVTASEDYARSLLRLAERLDNHRKSGDGVFSFAIFGGPGSGKSFIAKQVARAVDTDGIFTTLEFNLAQMSEPAQLVEALRDVQARGLGEKVPLVLFDEFDTAFGGHKGGWLPSFLMPMQDAKFYDGARDYELGKCVFVFIGGTFRGHQDFTEWAFDEHTGKTQKGPDFRSRLDSILTAPAVEVDKERPDDEGAHALLQRAVLLRVKLATTDGLRGATHIEPALLSWLLNVPLTHGVRSMEKLLLAGSFMGARVLRLRHLPATEVLRIHVQGAGTADHDPVAFLSEIGAAERWHEAPLALQWRAP